MIKLVYTICGEICAMRINPAVFFNVECLFSQFCFLSLLALSKGKCKGKVLNMRW